MRTRGGPPGYTLIEIVVGMVIFTVGALALAASSAIIAETMATSALREQGLRIASSRIAKLTSQCEAATSGRETVQQMESAWFVARPGPSRVSITESVSYMSPRGARTQTYRTTVWCRN
jgi:prepilin-type N-terminal cleavage/methylation domain-containing protein